MWVKSAHEVSCFLPAMSNYSFPLLTGGGRGVKCPQFPFYDQYQEETMCRQDETFQGVHVPFWHCCYYSTSNSWKIRAVSYAQWMKGIFQVRIWLVELFLYFYITMSLINNCRILSSRVVFSFLIWFHFPGTYCSSSVEAGYLNMKSWPWQGITVTRRMTSWIYRR